MDIQPSFETFEELSKKGNIITLYTDLVADCETPVRVYARLRKHLPAFLFESIVGGEQVNRYSFIGAHPRKIYSSLSERTQVTHRNGETEKVPTPTDPLSLIETEMQQYQPVDQPELPPFIGGAVGFVSYEYISCVESTVPRIAKNDLQLPIMYYMIADSVIVFDHAKQVLRVCHSVHVDGQDSLAEAYALGIEELKKLVATLNEPIELPQATSTISEEMAVPAGNFTQVTFKESVKKAKEFIHAGDIIQVVLSQRFEQPYTQSPLDLYRALRLVNPSPYMFIIETEEFSTVGASPEVHVRLTDDLVEIRPIAGTRPRGKTHREDLAYKENLLADEKEKAEHLMLVDLARNDIGRVCQYESVAVPEYMTVENYSHVMHIVSQVEGKIQPDKNAFDLLRATFPAGTVSGAPKVRAMQIIAEAEPTCRGVYSGALGYFSYDGNHDSCIAIRTALIKDEKIFIQSGAGIVADSDPESEYQETINKAKGMIKAVSLSKRFSP